jgi:hypothetical protein
VELGRRKEGDAEPELRPGSRLQPFQTAASVHAALHLLAAGRRFSYAAGSP